VLVQDGDVTPKNVLTQSKNPREGQKCVGVLAPPTSPSLDAKKYTFNIIENA